MSLCPTCREGLSPERIGGDRSNGSRPALFCAGCNTVWPDAPHLHLVPDHRRRDLDDLGDEP